MQTPRLLGDYEIGDRIGAGSMGTVYRARKRALQMDAVVKVLHPHWTEDPEVAARFETEATSAASVDHINTVRVLDYGHQDGLFYIAMEYVEGLNLKDLLRRIGPPRQDLGILIFRDLCRGLEAAHEKGVIHRDLKPENLAITSRGVVKIMDFGLARRTGADSGLTMQGTVLGTAAYMSPEQALGRNVDERSDIFSLGLVAYELFSGRRAFPGNTYGEVTHNVLNATPLALSSIVPQLDHDVLALIDDMMLKDVNRRCQTVSIARDRLEVIARRLDLHREDTLLRDLIAGAQTGEVEVTVMRRGTGRETRGAGEAAGTRPPQGGGAGVSDAAAAGAEDLANARKSEPAGGVATASTNQPAAAMASAEAEAVPATGATDEARARTVERPQDAPPEAKDAGAPAPPSPAPAPVVPPTRRRWWLLLAILVVAAAVWIGKGVVGNRGPTEAPPPALVRLEMDPSSQQVHRGETASFDVTGIFEGDSTATLTDGVTWSSSDTFVATIAPDGTAAARGAGEATITAALGSIVAEARLIVIAREPESLRLEPSTLNLRVGESAHLEAWLAFSEGSPEDVTSRTSWEVIGDASAVRSDGAGGLTAAAPGRARVRATHGGFTAEATIHVSGGASQDEPQGPFQKRFRIAVRPPGSAVYVLIDGDPTRHDASYGSFDYVLGEGRHTFRVGTASGEVVLAYTVSRGDPNRTLLLKWQEGLVDPAR